MTIFISAVRYACLNGQFEVEFTKLFLYVTLLFIYLFAQFCSLNVVLIDKSWTFFYRKFLNRDVHDGEDAIHG